MGFRQPTSADFVARKIGVIVYASLVNFFVAAALSQQVERHLIWRYSPTATRCRNLASLCVDLAIIAVFAYLLRQISEKMPLPFRSPTFDPSQVKEVKGSVLTAFTLFIFFGDDIKAFRDLIYAIV